MDLLDRLLGHDAWTTRQLLLRCRDLTDEQLDRAGHCGPAYQSEGWPGHGRTERSKQL